MAADTPAEAGAAKRTPTDAATSIYFQHLDWRNADAGESVDYDQDVRPDAFNGFPGEIKLTLTETGGARKALRPDRGTPVAGLVIQNASGLPGDVWYLNEVGFVNGSASQYHL